MSDIAPTPRLNVSTAHDTGFYDPKIHDNQIVALYETDARAQSAKDTLVNAGFPSSAIQVLARNTTAGADVKEDESIWGAIRSLFVPDEDRTIYNGAVARGHAMLVVTPDQSTDRAHLVHVLEQTEPLDFDARLEEWRQSGYDAISSDTDGSARAGAVPSAPVAPPLASSSASMNAADKVAARVEPIQNRGAAIGDDQDTIKVMEERLRVGKREVPQGAVRIRSYVVERPVEEQIRLREEHVTVDRRQVDRPANAVDIGGFEERVIEARATSEEPVISKETRVVEEIGLNKTSTERTETVRDTVRKTEVDIEGASRTANQEKTLAGVTGPTGAPNATPGASTSGANSPRR